MERGEQTRGKRQRRTDKSREREKNKDSGGKDIERERVKMGEIEGKERAGKIEGQRG